MIYAKILAFQQQQIVLKKTGKNPHFNSKYVPLNEVLESITGPLNELKVVIIQLPTETGLRTVLHDTEDKTEIECFLPFVEASTTQKLGSNITYNRRYSLVTLLGLGDEDDDGNTASTPKPTQEVKEEDIPNGSHSEVDILDQRQGVSKSTGKPYQRVKTSLGTAWNNDKDGIILEIGETYSVVVEGGNIIQATPYNERIDDLSEYSHN